MEISGHIALDKVNALGQRQTNHSFLARKPATGEQRLDPFVL